MARRPPGDSELWKRMVLRSMPLPAWLGVDAPEGDVVVSTRVRYARNLRGRRFPHHAGEVELRAIAAEVVGCYQASELALHVHRRLTVAESEYLVGCRLLSPEFPIRGPGRVLLLDDDRSIGVMVNEEDHVRIQALTAGWSPQTALRIADLVLREGDVRLAFARAEPWGYLTASPFNAGAARRISAMFHLIGLAHAKRTIGVLQALAEQGLVARGLFGESSRAVGAFFQVSATEGADALFLGACDYLLREERTARRELPRKRLDEQARAAVRFAVEARQITLADALRVLGWARWASAVGLEGFPASFREVDQWLAILEVRSTADEDAAARQRADFLRARLEGAA